MGAWVYFSVVCAISNVPTHQQQESGGGWLIFAMIIYGIVGFFIGNSSLVPYALEEDTSARVPRIARFFWVVAWPFLIGWIIIRSIVDWLTTET